MSKIYLPVEVQSNNCPVMVSNGRLRLYDRTSQNYNDNVHYYDFYLDNNYITTEGYGTAYNQNCMSTDNFTTEFYYRNDFDKILLIFFILLIILIYFPYKMISRLFGRWLKL